MEDLPEEIVKLPMCGLAKLVRFKNGRCPYSGHKSCEECLENDKNFELLDILLELGTENFGEA